jgi:hypothetical protein
VVTDDWPASDGQGDIVGSGNGRAGDDARVNETAGTAAMVGAATPDGAGAPCESESAHQSDV